MEALFHRVEVELREEEDFHKREYWQGKKDGLRTSLMLINSAIGENKESGFWKSFNDSSHGKRITKDESLKLVLENSIYHIGDILYTIKEKKIK